ncbi:hypothetical protein EDB89DRAFT_2152098 [Lactarius sanguifluus]|nr:hypothetical protein EDB89DRAFT_2152098 [Lactarius sanguifluus]
MFLSSCLQLGFLSIANFKKRHSNLRIGQTVSTSSQARAIEQFSGLAFLPDGQGIVSYSHDRTILLSRHLISAIATNSYTGPYWLRLASFPLTSLHHLVPKLVVPCLVVSVSPAIAGRHLTVRTLPARVESILKSSNCDADGLKRSTVPSIHLSFATPLHRSCLHPRPIDFTSSPLKPVLLLDLSSSRSLPRAQARPLYL